MAGYRRIGRRRGMGQIPDEGTSFPGSATTPWWQTAIGTAISTTGKILTSKYGVPPAGTYISTPTGTIYTQLPGSSPLSIPPFSIGGGIESTWVYLGLAALLAVIVVKSLGK